jgi:hypothetical protein
MRRLALLAFLLSPALHATTAEDIVSSAVEAALSDANLFTGEDLYRRRDRAEFFLGYVTGVVDTGSMTGPTLRRYCAPKGATNAQMADVAYKFLEANPARRHLGAAYLVRQSFHESWPCRMEPVSQPSQKRAPSL